MDPDAVARIIEHEPRFNVKCRQACEDLRHWLDRGGFPPKWSQFPTALRRYVRWGAGGYRR